jgi:hypothetical protein
LLIADPSATDGADQQTVNSNAAKDDIPIALFKKADLKYGVHSIKVTVVNASPPNVCELDRFMYVRRAG